MRESGIFLEETKSSQLRNAYLELKVDDANAPARGDRADVGDDARANARAHVAGGTRGG